MFRELVDLSIIREWVIVEKCIRSSDLWLKINIISLFGYLGLIIVNCESKWSC